MWVPLFDDCFDLASGRGYLCLRVALIWITYEIFDNFGGFMGQRISNVCVTIHLACKHAAYIE